MKISPDNNIYILPTIAEKIKLHIKYIFLFKKYGRENNFLASLNITTPNYSPKNDAISALIARYLIKIRAITVEISTAPLADLTILIAIYFCLYVA